MMESEQISSPRRPDQRHILRVFYSDYPSQKANNELLLACSLNRKKSLLTFVMSFLPSVRTNRRGSHSTDLGEICYWGLCEDLSRNS
jgi:hypothetical protein